MIGTIVFLGIWVGVIALVVRRREDNRETEEHHVVKRDFYKAFGGGELWPRITCSCGYAKNEPAVSGMWVAKLEVKSHMKKHIRETKKMEKVPTEW